MTNLPPFALTNEQRKALALSPIEEAWDVVQLKDSIFLYFDGDILRKSITVTEKSYKENELNRKTSDERTMLPPLTEKGKPKKLNYTGYQSINPKGTYFRWAGTDGDLQIANYTTQQTYYTSYGSGRTYHTWQEVREWIAGWIADTSKEDYEDLERFKTAERKNVKLKEGDFFTFKIGRREYGFGRILLDVRAVKKSVKAGKLKEPHYGLTRLMAQPLMVKVYKKISDEPVADLAELCRTPAFLAQQIMDNRLFYGEYKIIGNLQLEPQELEFPISIGMIAPNDGEKSIYFQYGMIYLTTPMKAYSAYCDSVRASGVPIGSVTAYRVNSIGPALRVLGDIPAMKRAIETSGTSQTETQVFNAHMSGQPNHHSDLRHPANATAKKAIFEYFGLDANKNYWENYQMFLQTKNQK